jgi:hypothetical protein
MTKNVISKCILLPDYHCASALDQPVLFSTDGHFCSSILKYVPFKVLALFQPKRDEVERGTVDAGLSESSLMIFCPCAVLIFKQLASDHEELLKPSKHDHSHLLYTFFGPPLPAFKYSIEVVP